MTLDELNPDDWRALAGVPEGATKIEGLDEAAYERLDAAGIVYPLAAYITRYGQGVIAAARVRVALVEAVEPVHHSMFPQNVALEKWRRTQTRRPDWQAAFRAGFSMGRGSAE
jgi:hypothetical protein